MEGLCLPLGPRQHEQASQDESSTTDYHYILCAARSGYLIQYGISHGAI
jgi:hypothetical protein